MQPRPFAFCSKSESGAGSGGGPSILALRLDESAWVRFRRCTSPGDTAFQAAYADLSSDKERLGFGILRAVSVLRCGQLALVDLHHVLAHHLRARGRRQLVRELLDTFHVVAGGVGGGGATCA